MRSDDEHTAPTLEYESPKPRDEGSYPQLPGFRALRVIAILFGVIICIYLTVLVSWGAYHTYQNAISDSYHVGRTKKTYQAVGWLIVALSLGWITVRTARMLRTPSRVKKTDRSNAPQLC
jgi:hypothetical protein